jgi:hypothetical protein
MRRILEQEATDAGAARLGLPSQSEGEPGSPAARANAAAFIGTICSAVHGSRAQAAASPAATTAAAADAADAAYPGIGTPRAQLRGSARALGSSGSVPSPHEGIKVRLLGRRVTTSDLEVLTLTTSGGRSVQRVTPTSRWALPALLSASAPGLLPMSRHAPGLPCPHSARSTSQLSASTCRRWARATAVSVLAGRQEVQQLSEAASERDALQEIYRSVQELQHNLRSEIQRLHLDVRQLKDRVNHMALQRRGSGHQ